MPDQVVPPPADVRAEPRSRPQTHRRLHLLSRPAVQPGAYVHVVLAAGLLLAADVLLVQRRVAAVRPDMPAYCHLSPTCSRIYDTRAFRRGSRRACTRRRRAGTMPGSSRRSPRALQVASVLVLTAVLEPVAGGVAGNAHAPAQPGRALARTRIGTAVVLRHRGLLSGYLSGQQSWWQPLTCSQQCAMMYTAWHLVHRQSHLPHFAQFAAPGTIPP